MLPKHPWLKKCLEHLEKLPQIKAIATTEPYNGRILADGKLTIQTSDRSTNQIDYIFVIKPKITADTLELQFEYLDNFRKRLDDSYRCLLIAKDLSDFVVNHFFEKNIEFIDTNGTIYLNNPAFYILVRHSSRQSSTNSPAYNLTANSLKFVYTLLQDPQRLDKLDQRDLAEITGIDPKTVARSLATLSKLHYLQRKYGEYQIADYRNLFERWEIGYIESLRSSLFIGSFRPLHKHFFSELADELVKVASLHNLLIGGELGAAIATNYLRPVSAVMHIPKNQNYRQIMAKLRLVPDPEGSITFLQQFGDRNKWPYDEKLPLADPLLLHAELMMNPDERLKETAQRLYEENIANRPYSAYMG